MSWRLIYEDLSEFASDQHLWADLPLDGAQAIIVNGSVHLGYDRYFRAIDTDASELIGFSKDSETDIKLRYPDAKIIRGKTTTTRRFHEIEVMLGKWAPENKRNEPSDDWVKDVIGWRIWYADNSVLDSKATAWADLPNNGVQVVILYENWNHGGGKPYRQVLSGADFYFAAPGPDGRDIVTTSNDPEAEIVSRYPGAIIKRGSFINQKRAKKISDAAFTAVNF
jgi:hypothetical protein